MGRMFFKVNGKDVAKRDYYSNVVVNQDEGVLSSFFDRYNVPEEYRSLFFYKSLIGDDIKEFITNTKLLYVVNSPDGLIYRKDTSKECQQYHIYFLNNIKNNYNIDEVKKFFFRLDESNYIDRYLMVMNEYFFLNLDLYNINRISDSDDIIELKRNTLKKLVKKNRV